jgi:hypothetical protein
VFTVDLDTILVDCDPQPLCVRLKRDKPLHSSLNPTVEQVLLNSDEIAAICEAYADDNAGTCEDA